MKKLSIIIFLVLAMLKIQAQDYLISFAGAGDTTVVGTVKVDNLTSGATVTMNGGDTLHLFAPVGIDALNVVNGNIQIYPNPMVEKSVLTFAAPENGHAIICIVDLSGKTINQISLFLSSGKHSFNVSGIKRGMYFVKVTGKNYFYSVKLISQSNLQSDARIENASSRQYTPSNQVKNAAATIDMAYTSGDQLLYKGISGIYSTIVPDMPFSSKTITFNFAACTDAGNNNYSIVQVGTQTWMAENLNVGVRIDGGQEQTNNSIIEKYCYNNDVNNCNTYGGLYQWNEMMQYMTTPGVQGICPAGWHIAADGAWTILATYLGAANIAGGKMKSTGTIEAGTGLWYSPNFGATNESGFTAFPAGYRYNDGLFYNTGSDGYWWSSTEYGTNSAWYRYVYTSYSTIFSSYEYHKNSGFSVRCLRDESNPFTCGTSITLNHVAGAVAPVNKTTTYGTVTGIPGEPAKCWITSNLGADHQAIAVDDATEASAGWHWQFNRKQGYKHDGVTRTPNTTWITLMSENSDWIAANDPCTIELGSGWRIPTDTEWANVDAVGNWTTWSGPWNSDLKLHAAGYLRSSDGALILRGSYGQYWSSTQLEANSVWSLIFYTSVCDMFFSNKADGLTLRCLRD